MRNDKILSALPVLFFLIVCLAVILFYATLVYFLPDSINHSLRETVTQNRPLLFLSVLIPASILAWITHLLIKHNIKPINELTESVDFLTEDPKGFESDKFKSPHINKLYKSIRHIALELSYQKESLDAELKKASARLASERDILGTIINQVSRGLIVTNASGNILLFNDNAEKLLSFPNASPPIFLGLGRSIYAILNEGLSKWALLEIQENRPREIKFIDKSSSGAILQVSVLSTSKMQEKGNVFLFFIQDVTELKQTDDYQNKFVDDGIRRMKDSIAVVKSVAENLKSFPDADKKMQQKFFDVIVEESERVFSVINEYEENYISSTKRNISVSLIGVFEFTSVLKNVNPRIEIGSALTNNKHPVYLFADPVSLSVAVLYLSEAIEKLVRSEVKHACSIENSFLLIKWNWNGEEIPNDALKEHTEKQIKTTSFSLPHSLSEILVTHRGEWWQKSESDLNHSVSIIIPLTKQDVGNLPKVNLEKIRAEFFDFDLFSYDSSDEILDTPLSALTATVFDTETTGLDPVGGDKLVSIGAVRLVNGKVREDQTFSHLINPGREISIESQKIHGITSDMVSDKPDSEKVLSDFHRFCSQETLVAHNAAFDMRFLELESTSVLFKQPVLDTLLLSSILHPNTKGHSVDDLAKRFNIPKETRHDALGDALMTARIFEKMIALLNKAGIKTVGDAIRASKESFYANLRY